MEYTRQELTTNLIVRLRKDMIIETVTRPDWSGEETLENAKENMAAIVRISEGQLYPTLNFLSDNKVLDEAQDYYQKHKPAAIAAGMVARSMIQVLLGNIFLKFKKLSIPTKIFNNPDDAVQWLHLQKNLYRKSEDSEKIRA